MVTYKTLGNPASGLCCKPFWKYISLVFSSTSWTIQRLLASHFLSHSSFSLLSGERRNILSVISILKINRHLTVFWFHPQKTHLQLVASFLLYFFYLFIFFFFFLLLLKWPNCLAFLSSIKEYISFFSSYFNPDNS